MNRQNRYYDLCRLCASYDAVKMNLFDEDGRSRQLVEKIQTCLPFKIEEDDRLPKCLCYRCMYNLENFYDFRTACVNAVSMLERFWPLNGVDDEDYKEINRQFNDISSRNFKDRIKMPILIPEAPVVNPNAALGTPPRLCFDDNDVEEIVQNSGTDEGAEEIEDEYEMDMETNPSDFLEMTPMVTGESEESDSKNIVNEHQDSPSVFQHTSEQHEVYVCSLCNKAFSSKGHLSLHARIHVGAGDVIGEKVITDDHTSYKRPYQCDLCNKSYSTAKHRWGHVSTTHRGHPAVTCGYCSRIYSTRTNLEEHIKSRHAGLPALSEVVTKNQLSRAENRFQCKTCPKMYTNITDLNKHSRLCTGDQRIEFSNKNPIQKGKGTPDISDLSSMDSDSENKDYKTAEAKLSKNPQLTILKQALTKGIGVKQEFEEKFRRTNVNNTNRVHSDPGAQSKLNCAICHKNFPSAAVLKEHETTHRSSDDDLVHCILCNKDFATKSLLSNHILTSHGVDPDPILKCQSIKKKGVEKTSANQQQQKTDKNEDKVSAVNPLISEMNTENDLEDGESNQDNMIEIETVFVCEICTRDFNDRASLWLHIRATHKEFAAFACGVCLKICSDNAQLLDHVNMYHGGSKLQVSEQRRYSCTICGRQHDSRKKLIAHVSIHNVDPTYDPANFVQLNSSYYNEIANNVESNDQIDFDGEENDKVDCHICFKSFPNEDHLIRHQRNAHKAEQMPPTGDLSGNGNSNSNANGNKAQYHLFFVCELCGSSHPSKWERWLHVSSDHANELAIKCDRDDCGKIFATKALRNEHMQHHQLQGSSPNTCEICGKLWGSRVDYWKHVMGVHSDTVPLICGVCLKVFPDVFQLSAHVKAKHWPLTNGDFSCDVCGRPYSNKSKMSRHRKIHGIETNGFDTTGNDTSITILNDSSKLDNIGTAESGFTCSMCDNITFINLDDLCNHRRITHGLFPCDLCNKFYGRTSHLWKHVNRVHKGHKDVTCRYCLKTSASRDHLAAHIAKIHRYEPEVRKITKETVTMKSETVEDNFMHYCEKCNKGFHKRYLLRRHMKGCQNYRKDPGALLTRCRACERIFKDRASLQKHIENHHSTYTCHLCNETITSKLGIMTHNRIKHMNHPDLTCELSGCKKLFRTKEDLESHKKDHKYHSSPNVCDFCGDTVENKLKLKMHVLSLHRNEIGVSCGVCLIPMKDPKDLKKHVADVHGSVLSNPNTCQVCGKQYASKWKAFDHTKKCHGKVFRTCKQCLAVFTSDSEILHHYEEVHNVPNDQLAAFEQRMEIGSKSDMYDDSKLRDSLEVVVKEEPEDLEYYDDQYEDGYNSVKKRRTSMDTYDCEMCPEIFLNLETLTEHCQNVHNVDPSIMIKKIKLDIDPSKSTRKMRNRKNFECKSCKKQFCTKTLFWNHINNCTRRHPYNKIDSQGVPTTSILENHLKNNNQIKREIDSDIMMNESNLNIPDFNLFEDINMQLAGVKPVSNLVPSMSAKGTGNVKCSRKDSRKVYDETTNTECACEVCGKQWPAKKHLWQHLIRFHRAEAAVTCGVCLKLCKCYDSLAEHLKEEHGAILSCEGNNFTCKTCGRYHNARSKLLLHMSIHINLNGNYWCQNCQKNYDTEERFNEHQPSCTKEACTKKVVESANVADDVKCGNEEEKEEGSLIGDGASAIGEMEEEMVVDGEEFDSQIEGDGDMQADSNSDDSENSDNSGDSEAESDSRTSDDSDEGEDENEMSSRIDLESRSNSRTTPEVACNSESVDSEMENFDNIDEKSQSNSSHSNHFNTRFASPEEKDSENKNEQPISDSDDLQLKTGKIGSESSSDEVEDEDDDGPPVLSPIPPIKIGDEIEENEESSKIQHQLSPMMAYSDEQEDEDEDNENFDETKNHDIDDEDVDSEYGNGQLEVVVESNPDQDEEYQGSSGSSIRDEESNEIQINGTDGSYVVANDIDGNQILIQSNLLELNEEDSNGEEQEYVTNYQDGNYYEIEEYQVKQNEGEDELELELDNDNCSDEEEETIDEEFSDADKLTASAKSQ